MDKSDPELLREHLLGDAHAGPGLLRRVASKVRSLARDTGPGYKTGSIIGLVDHDQDVDAEDEGQVFELYLEVRGLVGLDKDREQQRTYLARYRLSDVDALAAGGGLLDHLRTEVVMRLDRSREQDKEWLLEVVEVLQGWLQSACPHSLVATEVVGDITVMRCENCDVQVGVDGKGRAVAI